MQQLANSAFLIDPEGNALYARSGEFKAAEMATLLKQGIPYYRKKGTLNEKPLHFDLEADRTADTPLRFPGKVLADDPGERLFIADRTTIGSSSPAWTES